MVGERLSLASDGAGFVVVFAVGQEAFDELDERRCLLGYHFLSVGAGQQLLPDLSFVLLCSSASLDWRKLSHPFASSVRVLIVDVHEPELPGRARFRVATLLSSHTQGFLPGCETRP